MQRNARAIMQRNLKVGRFSDFVVESSPGATRRAIDQLNLKQVTIGGVQFTPDELTALAESPEPDEPSEQEREAEYESQLCPNCKLKYGHFADCPLYSPVGPHENTHETEYPWEQLSREQQPFYMRKGDWDK